MIHVKKKTNMMVLIIFYLCIGTFCGIRDTEGLHCTEQWFLDHSEKVSSRVSSVQNICKDFNFLQTFKTNLLSSQLLIFTQVLWDNFCTHFFMLESVTKLSQHFVDHIRTLCYYSDAYRTACPHKGPRPFHISI